MPKHFEDSKEFKGVPIDDEETPQQPEFNPDILKLSKHSKGFLLGVGVGLMAPIVATGLIAKHIHKKHQK